jgi:hypothetical protein
MLVRRTQTVETKQRTVHFFFFVSLRESCEKRSGPGRWEGKGRQLVRRGTFSSCSEGERGRGRSLRRLDVVASPTSPIPTKLRFPRSFSSHNKNNKLRMSLNEGNASITPETVASSGETYGVRPSLPSSLPTSIHLRHRPRSPSSLDLKLIGCLNVVCTVNRNSTNVPHRVRGLVTKSASVLMRT